MENDWKAYVYCGYVLFCLVFFCAFLFFVFWLASLQQSLNRLHVGSRKGSRRLKKAQEVPNNREKEA
jgi:hypothetical protein